MPEDNNSAGAAIRIVIVTVFGYLSAPRGLSESISVSTGNPAVFSNSAAASFEAFSTNSLSAFLARMNTAFSINAYRPYNKSTPVNRPGAGYLNLEDQILEQLGVLCLILLYIGQPRPRILKNSIEDLLTSVQNPQPRAIGQVARRNLLSHRGMFVAAFILGIDLRCFLPHKLGLFYREFFVCL
jgi:hypothetical protein